MYNTLKPVNQLKLVNQKEALLSPLAIAPMIDWTYTHFRVFMRILAPQALVYTDMQTTGAVINNPKKSLCFSSDEHPIALQLGGSNVHALGDCAKMAQECGFDEVNLNLGCPSDRVQAGRFGACLMAEPDLVVRCISAMKDRTGLPISVKTRIGIDNQDSYEFFYNFVMRLVEAGADKLIVHARKAWLKGLSPKQNRTIPPVQYDFVYRIKQEVPIPVVINGNIESITAINYHLNQVDGVMLGRLACHNPYEVAKIHHALFSEVPLITRKAALNKYFNYLTAQYEKKIPLSLLIKPVLGIAHGLTNSKRWKESLLDAQRAGRLDTIMEIFNQLEHDCLST